MSDMRLFVVGDSKSTVTPPATYVYLADLADSFMLDQASGVDYVAYSPPPSAGGGWGTLGAADRINSVFAKLPAGHKAPAYALVNLGVNDPYPVVEATFKSNMGAALDAIHTKFPTTQVLIARIWQRGRDHTTLNDVWIPDLIATRAGWCAVGPDERVEIEAGDNGVTYSDDGIHPNVAGYVRMAAAWKAAMGY